MPILCLGDDEDPHIGSVVRCLERMGCETTVLGLGANFGLVYSEVTGGRQPMLQLRGNSYASEEIMSVWDRARSSAPLLNDERWQYAFRERKAFLESLEALAPSARWMNSLDSSVRASSKIAQLMAARRAGLKIPETYVTNDVSQLAPILRRHPEGIVFKVLTWLATTDGGILFTNELDASVIEKYGHALRPAPCIFQVKIRKQFDLRVTCVGRDVFAARIDSQMSSQGELDWRRDQDNLSYSPYRLPSSVGQALLTIMRDLGLVFGAFDLARSAEGDFVFFEVNPSGNWLWLEEEVGLSISQSVAAWLAGR